MGAAGNGRNAGDPRVHLPARVWHCYTKELDGRTEAWRGHRAADSLFLAMFVSRCARKNMSISFRVQQVSRQSQAYKTPVNPDISRVNRQGSVLLDRRNIMRPSASPPQPVPRAQAFHACCIGLFFGGVYPQIQTDQSHLLEALAACTVETDLALDALRRNEELQLFMHAKMYSRALEVTNWKATAMSRTSNLFETELRQYARTK